MESVYCAVQTDYLNKHLLHILLKRLISSTMCIRLKYRTENFRKFFNTNFISLYIHSIVSNIRAYDKAVLMQWNDNTITMSGLIQCTSIQKEVKKENEYRRKYTLCLAAFAKTMTEMCVSYSHIQHLNSLSHVLGTWHYS
jgi:hypothetical protein